MANASSRIEQNQTWIQVKGGQGLTWSSPSAAGYTGEEIGTVDHAIASFGFLINDYEPHTFKDLSRLIAKAYNSSNQKIRSVIELLGRGHQGPKSQAD